MVPHGKAVYATKDNLKAFEERRADLEKQEAEKLASANKRSEKIAALGTIIIKAVVGEEGKLFGSVGVREIEEAINAAGGEVSKNEINLPDGAYKQIGEFLVDIQLHSDVTLSVKVLIEPE
ncbi:MAG: 50S ribosomal protein L9 [Porticoccaceae bacterium]|nr:MAG: 50S ribosomal protein L9 [Porticoccaceae bacterium]